MSQPSYHQPLLLFITEIDFYLNIQVEALCGAGLLLKLENIPVNPIILQHNPAFKGERKCYGKNYQLLITTFTESQNCLILQFSSERTNCKDIGYSINHRKEAPARANVFQLWFLTPTSQSKLGKAVLTFSSF